MTVAGTGIQREGNTMKRTTLVYFGSEHDEIEANELAEQKLSSRSYE